MESFDFDFAPLEASEPANSRNLIGNLGKEGMKWRSQE
jgi:hypothetical protein